MYKYLKWLEDNEKKDTEEILWDQKKAVCKKSKQKTRGIGICMRSDSEYKNEGRVKYEY